MNPALKRFLPLVVALGVVALLVASRLNRPKVQTFTFKNISVRVEQVDGESYNMRDPDMLAYHLFSPASSNVRIFDALLYDPKTDAGIVVFKSGGSTDVDGLEDKELADASGLERRALQAASMPARPEDK